MTTLTPDEAREQPCPFFRYCVNERGVIADRDGPIYVHENCKGPDCKIGWRWAYQTSHHALRVNDAVIVEGPPAPRGYCGFAGRPN